MIYKHVYEACGGSVVESLAWDIRVAGFQSDQKHCIVSLSKTLYPLLSLLVLVQHRNVLKLLTRMLSLQQSYMYNVWEHSMPL